MKKHPLTRFGHLVFLSLVLGGILCSGRTVAAEPADGQNTLTYAEKAGGWKLLFDGKTTEGWRRFKGTGMPDRWKVADGTLLFEPKAGKSGGDIITVEQFDNFELVLDWKISPGGNSGVMYRVTEIADAPWMTGPEYQLLDNAKHPDGRRLITSAASCYAMYPPTKDATRPVGEWNRTRLVVIGNHVEHWLNGEKVVEYELGSEDWQKRLKAGKFKNLAHYGKEPKGHIDLQDHGNTIAFRNIKLRVIVPGSECSTSQENCGCCVKKRGLFKRRMRCR